MNDFIGERRRSPRETRRAGHLRIIATFITSSLPDAANYFSSSISISNPPSFNSSQTSILFSHNVCQHVHHLL